MQQRPAAPARTYPQLQLPRYEADGVTHARDCECTRCETGYRPSEAERRTAARRFDEQREREAAEAALARRRERARQKALRLRLALDEEERRTADRLREQQALLARLKKDRRLEAVLQARRAGRPEAQALAEAERRVGPRSTAAGSASPPIGSDAGSGC